MAARDSQIQRLSRFPAFSDNDFLQLAHGREKGNGSSVVLCTDWKEVWKANWAVDSADHYAYRISGKPALTQPGDPCIADVNAIADLQRLKEQAATVDSLLAECVKLDDVQIEFTNFEDKLVKRWRSTILSQAIHHATEHRAQIASALEAKGFTPMNLDDLDLWEFEKTNG